MAQDPTLVDTQPFPCLTVVVGGKRIQTVPLRGELTIGRAEDNALRLADPRASRHHARVHLQAGVHILTDLGSANGTWVGGTRLSTPHTLRSGDPFHIGETTITYYGPGQCPEDTEPEAARHRRAGGLLRHPGAMSRRALAGLILAGLIIVLALVTGGLYLFKPSVLESIGLIREPVATEAIQSPEATEAGVSATPEDEPTPGAPAASATPGRRPRSRVPPGSHRRLGRRPGASASRGPARPPAPAGPGWSAR